MRRARPQLTVLSAPSYKAAQHTHLVHRHDWVIPHQPLPCAVLAHVEVLHVQLRLELQQLLHQARVARLSRPVQGCVGRHVWQHCQLRVYGQQQLQVRRGRRMRARMQANSGQQGHASGVGVSSESGFGEGGRYEQGPVAC